MELGGEAIVLAILRLCQVVLWDGFSDVILTLTFRQRDYDKSHNLGVQPLKPLWSRDKACEKITRVNGPLAVADPDLQIRGEGGHPVPPPPPLEERWQI